MAFEKEAVEALNSSLNVLIRAEALCDLTKPREAELKDFLGGIRKRLGKEREIPKILKRLLVGFNAILCSLDGNSSWHGEVIDEAKKWFQAYNTCLIELEGEPRFRMASFGDRLTSELSIGLDLLAIAKDPATPKEQLADLAKNSDWEIRAGVGSNPASPPEILMELARDKDEGVRGYTAKNPYTPVEILNLLSLDSSEYVRDWLAQNPSITNELSEKLAQDLDWRPRFGVASNPNVTSQVLAKLANDPDERVAGIARKTLNSKRG